jgi:malonyl CoA-acyl carrier protein transacylase
MRMTWWPGEAICEVLRGQAQGEQWLELYTDAYTKNNMHARCSTLAAAHVLLS